MPGRVFPEGEHAGTASPPTIPAQAAEERARPKADGKTGEWLEGSVYSFKLHSFRECGEPLDDASQAKAFGKEPGVVLVAEVEIKAKERLNISPKDVRLNRAGIGFDTNIDFKRRFKGCTPLLQISRLNAEETVKGLVLFDIPKSEWNPKGLTLYYQPTRWGGASAVRVDLERAE
jgi:hypothetical protein